jgi:hypothetical protein
MTPCTLSAPRWSGSSDASVATACGRAPTSSPPHVIEAFLTDLAVQGHVAPAPPNQAMNALVLLDTRVLKHALAGHIHAIRAAQKRHVPVVMIRAAVAAVLSLLDGTAPLGANMRYGSGVCLREAVRLRGTDLEVQMQPLPVRAGQGTKHRCPTVPVTRTPMLPNHLAGVNL